LSTNWTHLSYDGVMAKKRVPRPKDLPEVVAIARKVSELRRLSRRFLDIDNVREMRCSNLQRSFRTRSFPPAREPRNSIPEYSQTETRTSR
jgi:hypothetical protein